MHILADNFGVTMKKFAISVKLLSISLLVYLIVSAVLIACPVSRGVPEADYDFNALSGVEDFPEGAWIRVEMRDGHEVFYRYFDSTSKNLLIFLHGSGSDSRYLRDMAATIASQGLADVVLPDLRGHGRSAERMGDIDYIGQLEDDLDELIEYSANRYLSEKVFLGGHSMGGGLVLRYAGNRGLKNIGGLILLAPYLGHTAPTHKPNNANWITVNVKRIIGLSMLHNIGIRFLNDLPVFYFNRPPEWEDELLPNNYSYRLAMNFSPNSYVTDIQAITKPALVVVGNSDESFYADKFEGMFKPVEDKVKLKIIEGVRHLEIVDNEKSRDAISSWLSNIAEDSIETKEWILPPGY